MNMDALIDDLPKGPLDIYRKQASFNWKKLKFVFEDPEHYQLKCKVWKTLENDPVFNRSEIIQTTEEVKRRTALQFHRYCQYKFLPPDIINWPYKRKTRIIMALDESMAVCYPDVSIKYAIGVSLFTNTLLSLGSERHRKVFEAVFNNKTLSCLALTEVAHGSNTKQMRTTATYDKNAQEFVINTPDFEAAKCWIGNLGKTCTLALLFAQLYTGGQCHGLHAFVVPIRDPKTLLPYPGIIVGDIGEKIGLHGIDNGFIMFRNYRIPRENLLNRTGDITPEGDYESSFTDPGRILGAALENLSAGRVGIMRESIHHLICAVTIAVRYAAIRKQFGPGDEEIAIIEYPLHQWRLFPYVASAAVLKIFVDDFRDDYLAAVERSNTCNGTTRLESLKDEVSEIHAMVSAAKPLLTWTCMHAIQECREACGGHGYLKSARLGELRNTCDPTVTYEGDNNVLIQQTSNWLLRQWNSVIENNTVHSPLQTCTFLLNKEIILKETVVLKNMEDVLSFDFIKKSFEWLITYLVAIVYNLQMDYVKEGHSKFDARNNTQVYKAAIISKSYSEYIAICYYWKKIGKVDPTLKTILEKLGLLYGLSRIDKYLVYFYQGNYANGPALINYVRDGIQMLCATLKPDIIGVIDALTFPDFIVNSVLGTADGKVYENLQREFFSNPGGMSRPNWWHEILVKDAPDLKLASKL